MRKINFRAWDKQLKRWTYALHVNGNGTVRVSPDGYPSNYICLEDSDRFEVVQFTGLQDVTGKDIYEGDVIERITDVEIWKDFGYVFFKEVGQIGFALKTKNSYSGINSNYKYKIIGNIFENPELLELGRETLHSLAS